MPGDEDGGGTSAFVVFSSMGFYTITPGISIYTIGSPIFSKSTLKLPNGKKFLFRHQIVMKLINTSKVGN